MKNQILDDIFNDDFRELVANDETIIWEGRPYISFFMRVYTALCWIIIVLLIANCFVKDWNLGAFGYPTAMVILMIYRLYKSKKIRYLITDQRIIFQLFENNEKTIHELPLEQIKKIDIKKIEKNHGAILLELKDPKQYTFETKDLKSGKKRNVPTLEMIENVEAVAQYIQSGVQQNQLPEG
ncbi:MAG: hypothetical protein AAF573_17830 [Bacteroidota bacterium]